MVAKGYKHTTIVIREDLLNKLKDYAYTMRIKQQEAVNAALEQFLADKKDLLSHK